MLPKHCPLCGALSDSSKVVTRHVFGKENDKYAFFYCSSCTVNYLHPQLSETEAAEFYNKEFEKFMDSRTPGKSWLTPEDHIELNRLTFERRLEYLSPYITSGNSVLDIGSSSGFMLLPLAEKGMDVWGIEPSGYFSDFSKKKGINTYNSLDSLTAHKGDKKFDLVMSFFVMEHVPDPSVFVKQCLELKKDSGKVIIEIPSAHDPLYSLYDFPEFERFYWSIAHHWYFTQKSIEFILNPLKVEYEILKYQRYGLANHLTWAYKGAPGGTKELSELFELGIDASYKTGLVKAGYFDTMVIVI
jgi:SAM-dependent methyltransferase